MFRNNAKLHIFKESNQNLSNNFWDRLPDEMWDNISNYIGYQKHPVAKLFTPTIIREIRNKLIYSLFIDAYEDTDNFKAELKYFQNRVKDHVFEIKGEERRFNETEIRQITVRYFEDFSYETSYDGLENYDFYNMFDKFEEELYNQYENNIFRKCLFITI